MRKHEHQILGVSGGFTLIELLTVLTILSILVAVAVPQYSDYKKRAYDTRAEADLRNTALGQEAYFFDNEEYFSCKNTACSALPGIAALSDGVRLQITAMTSGFVGTSTHARGSGKVFHWDTENGGLVE